MLDDVEPGAGSVAAKPNINAGERRENTKEVALNNKNVKQDVSKGAGTDPAIDEMLDNAVGGLTDKINATEALRLVAMRSARSLVQERARRINMVTKDLKKEGVQSIRGELSQKMQEAIVRAGEVDKTVVGLQTDSDPSKKALGFDTERAILKQELQDLAQIEQEGGDKDKVGEERKKIEKRLTELTEERSNLRDDKGGEIPDVLTNKALETAKNLKGENLTSEEEQKIRDNPLGYLEEKIVGAVLSDDPSDMRKLTDALGLTVEEAREFEEALKISDEEKPKWIKYGEKAGKVIGLSGLFALLMAWLASKDKQGRGGMG